MQNIIYKSNNIIPWDTQSAFKMNSYKTEMEENMVFCYLKSYVHGSDLVLCSYCFEEFPVGNDKISIYLGLDVQQPEKVMSLTFGYDGMESCTINGNAVEMPQFSSFKTDDEQGFYWCGEVVLKKELIESLFNLQLEEKSIFTLNMVQHFENGDFSVLYGDATKENYSPTDNMNVFVVLNY